MNIMFDDHGMPVAVDYTHPVDILEPEEPAPERDFTCAPIVVERIARTFFGTDPKITQVAWMIVLDDDSASIRACATRHGCSAAAISKRVKLISREFDLPVRVAHIAALERMERRQTRKGKRREDRNPPAASDYQAKTITPAEESGGRP